VDQHPDKPLDPVLSFEFLAGVYAQLTVLVVRLTADGVVISVNPESERVTGYTNKDLQGKNWWGLMFPGKLFAQVPKFTSPAQAGKFTRDYPLAMRTASGQVRVVAWTRFSRLESSTGQVEMVCLGVDITDRLLDADREATAAEPIDLESLGECPTLPDDGTGFVEPLAVSPPAAMKPEIWREAVEQAQARLAIVEDRLPGVMGLMETGDTASMRLVLRMIRGGTYERTLAPVWGQIEAMYRQMDVGLALGVSAETRELGNLVRKGERG